MVLDDRVELQLGAELGQLAQSIGGIVQLLVPASGAGGVDAERVATEESGGFGPLVVVLDRLLARLGIGIAEPAFIIDHDQQRFDPSILLPLLHLAQIRLVGGLILEHLARVFYGVQSKPLASGFCEIEVVQIAPLALKSLFSDHWASDIL